MHQTFKSALAKIDAALANLLLTSVISIESINWSEAQRKPGDRLHLDLRWVPIERTPPGPIRTGREPRQRGTTVLGTRRRQPGGPRVLGTLARAIEMVEGATGPGRHLSHGAPLPAPTRPAPARPSTPTPRSVPAAPIVAIDEDDDHSES